MFRTVQVNNLRILRNILRSKDRKTRQALQQLQQPVKIKSLECRATLSLFLRNFRIRTPARMGPLETSSRCRISTEHHLKASKRWTRWCSNSSRQFRIKTMSRWICNRKLKVANQALVVPKDTLRWFLITICFKARLSLMHNRTWTILVLTKRRLRLIFKDNCSISSWTETIKVQMEYPWM